VTDALSLGPVTIEVANEATRAYVLLGHPVAHSRSPAMQNAAFAATGLAAQFVLCDVQRADLDACLAALRERMAEGRIGGASVTIPHKRAVFDAMDDLAPEAALAGAVNTIVPLPNRQDPRTCTLRGHNTDITGLGAVFRDAGVDLRAARVVVLGNGGMARAAVVAALGAGAGEIRVLGRDPNRAQDMLDAIAAAWKGRAPALACAVLDDGAGKRLASADVLIQATSLGLHAGDALPIALDAAPSHLFVLDAVYAAGGTPLVRAAQARGLRGQDGLELLLQQGAAAFTLWTGQPAPLDAMRRGLAI